MSNATMTEQTVQTGDRASFFTIMRAEHEAELEAARLEYERKLNALRVQMAETETRLEAMGVMFQQEAARQVEAAQFHYQGTAATIKVIAERWKYQAKLNKHEARQAQANLKKAQARIAHLEKAVKRCLVFGAVMTAIACVVVTALFI